VVTATVAIVAFLTVTRLAVRFGRVTRLLRNRVEALTGFASAFFNVRLIAPATTSYLRLASTSVRARHRTTRAPCGSNDDNRRAE